MTEQPSTLYSTLHQDAFSKVLDMLRLRGTSVATGSVPAGGHLDYSQSKPCIYVFQQGFLKLIDPHSGASTEVQSGDVLLMVRAVPHQLANADEAPAQYVRGEFDFDSIFASRFLGTLPAVITLQRPGHKSHEWVDVCSSFMAFEAAHGYAGSTAMISRLLDLLFIRTLRSWASESALGQGWVSAAADPRIGRVLASIQNDPSRPWSLPQFAAVAGMSRTAFASRFLEVIGQSPIAYLNQWRLDLAADLLRFQNLSISELILQVGFNSEAAFGRAFKLRHGQPPMQWRRAVQIAR
jgi:AraC-like DNA-binding protein